MTAWLRPVVVLCTLAVTSPALAYDASWYKAAGLSGEYPNGFTMVSDATIGIRPAADPEADRSVQCLMKKNATYHQWNDRRVASDGLEFVSFNKIEDYELTADFSAELSRDADGSDAVIAFKKGDRWSYLVYASEGSFLMRFRDVLYVAGQDLIDQSKSVDPSGEEATSADEWMKLKCANGTTGWLLLRDVLEDPAFGSPNITDYGHAEDGPAPQ